MDYIDFYRDAQLFFHHSKDMPPFFHNYGMHAHEIYELCYLVSGDGIFTIEGTQYPLQHHSIYLIRSNEAHYTKLTNNEPYERIVLHFYPEILSVLDPNQELLTIFSQHDLGEQNFYPLDSSNQTIIDNIFQNIFLHPSKDSYSKRLSIIISLLSILAELNKIYNKNKNLQPEFEKQPVISDVLTYINEHLFEKITIEELCRHFFISRSHLCTLFKEYTSSTIWNYILIKRLISAKTMIQNGTSAKETASICGYKDYSAFFRAYKKYFHMPPTMK